MENVSPTLQLAFNLQMTLHTGRGIRDALRDYLTLADPNHVLTKSVRQILAQHQANSGPQGLTLSLNVYQSELVMLIDRSLSGEGILKSLEELVLELERQLNLEVDEHVAKIPFRAMLPVLFLQLPALVLIVVVPMLRSLIQSIGGS